MARKSIKQKSARPSKPYPDFPLFAHATGRWAKKIRGKLVYFGSWRDPMGAVAKYDEQREDLHAGRVPRPKGDGLTLRVLGNHYLTAQQRKVENGELRSRTFGDYYREIARMIAALGPDRAVDGLTAMDFAAFRDGLAKRLSPTALAKQIQVARSCFKFGFDMGMFDRPMRYGMAFTKPSRQTIRRARHASESRMFEAHEIRAMLEEASGQLHAMVLLAIGSAYGNTDIAEIPRSALDLAKGLVDFPRPKTAIPRRCPLWAETVEALRTARKTRPTPKTDSDDRLVFLTGQGRPWVREHTNPKGQIVWVDSLGHEFTKLLNRLDLRRKGVGFYSLRHTFRTIADEAGDRPAIDLIMGHQDASDMSVHYRERIDDSRLTTITDHVLNWLFAQ